VNGARAETLAPSLQIHHGFTCTTIPCPSVSHQGHEFGTALSPLDTGGFIVGAPLEDLFGATRPVSVDAGAVFRYNNSGSVVDSIGNPDPLTGDQFGAAVAGLGDGFMVIGAPRKDVHSPTGAFTVDVGAAYLYTTDGFLMTALENPTFLPGDGFGATVARMGDDALLVSRLGVGFNTASIGTVYSFTFDPVLLDTFFNPFPDFGDQFGASILALESDIVVIGAPGEGFFTSGAIHIFESTANLLDSVFNPSGVADARFGTSLAPVELNRFAVGAPGADAVYIYDTGGNLISTITNPIPAQVSEFGHSLAAMSDTRLLIGAAAASGSSGRVFLYDVDGCNLLEIEPPGGGSHPLFGWSLARCDADDFVIGYPGDDTHESDAGGVYLYQDVEAATHSTIGETLEVAIFGPGAGGCGLTQSCFVPTQTVVEVFGKVAWTNEDSSAHEIVSGIPSMGPDGCFASGSLGPGQSFTAFFDDRVVGDVPYYCALHITETGVLKIQKNDDPEDAILVSDGESIPFLYDHAGDEDWIQFFAVPTIDVVVSTTNIGDVVDTILTVYKLQTNGTLSFVSSVNNTGSGTGMGEFVQLTMPSAGFYYANVRFVDLGDYGFGTEYEVTVRMLTTSDLYVTAVDRVTLQTPLSAVATVNGGSPQVIPPSQVTVYNSLQDGLYSIAVSVATGILPREAPNASSPQAGNPWNQSYGNPRNVLLSGSVVKSFVFDSTCRITGSVHDQWTGAPIEGAAITLESTSGNNQGAVYDRYPLQVWNDPSWATSSTGDFPAGMRVPLANYRLHVEAGGYEALVITDAIASPLLNQSLNLDVSIVPVDLDGNQIADLWEHVYVPGNNLVPNGDNDGDKFINIHEYLAGTDPLDPGSKLSLEVNRAGTTIELAWPLTPGPLYSVDLRDGQTQQPWIPITGPADWQSYQSGFLDADTTPFDVKNYRINLSIP